MATKRHFNIEQLASLPNFYLINLSYDEKKLAFYYDISGSMELYTYDLEKNQLNQVSNGETPKILRSGFIWSRNNEDIFFTKDVMGNEKNDIYRFNINSKELTEISMLPEVQEYVVDTSHDGHWVSFMSNRHGQMNIFKMRTDGSEQTQLTAADNPCFGGIFSPDDKFIAFNTNEEGDLRNSDIYTLNLESGDIERVVQMTNVSSDNVTDWSDDGKLLYFTTDASGANNGGIYNLETKEVKTFGDGENNIIAVKLLKDNRRLICLRNKDSSVSPVIFDITTGEMTELDFPAGIAAGGQVKDDRYLFLTVNRPKSPSSLIMYDLEENTSKILIETDTGDLDSSLFTDAEHIWYESKDGTKIPAIIYKPKDFDPSKRYPGIINPHGGPTGQYFMNFSAFAQLMNDLGYVIMLPNVRGSTGYGVEFRDACRMDWGGKDHEDWVAGRQYLIDHVSVDPNRIAVFGGSYGGYATLVCMTKSPDLWSAGLAWIPVSHMKNLYDKSMEHFKYYFRQQMGDPVKDADLWEERSPLNYAQNLKSPLLLVHGEHDPRCPVTESTNFAARLDELGRKRGPDGDYEMVIFTDEGHGGSSDIQHRLRTWKLLIDFLDRRLN